MARVYDSPKEMHLARAKQRDIKGRYYWSLAVNGEPKCYAIAKQYFKEAEELRKKAEMAADSWPKKGKKKEELTNEE